MARQAMVQREVAMAVSIARARDSLQWFGGAYSVYISALGLFLTPLSRRSVSPSSRGAPFPRRPRSRWWWVRSGCPT
jgi:hypothetical protein